MGKGDRKSRKGKLFAKTYGVRRPKKKEKGSVVSMISEATSTDKATSKKAKK